MKQIPIMKPYFNEDELKEIEPVLKSGWVAQGPKVAEFEKLVAAHEGIEYGIATTSCTTALHLLMEAMGLGPGYELIVPSYTFIATANSVLYTGAEVVLADVDTKTYNIDCDWLEDYLKRNYTIKEKGTFNKKTGKQLFGLVAVNLFGLCADIPRVNKLAEQYRIKVIEDSACALGAKIGNTHEGGFGNPSCLSFHPRKSITTGEGGMILTDDQKIAEKARRLRSHSAAISEVERHKAKGYLLPDYEELGYNYRMNDIQAAVGIAQMKKFDDIVKIKKNKAKKYDQLIAGLKGLNIPFVPAGYSHTYQSYVCMLDNEALGLGVEEANEVRNRIMEQMEEQGIATRQGTHAVHTLTYYRKTLGYKPEDLPGAYKCDRLSLSLPLYVEMNDEDQEEVVRVFKEALDKALKEKSRC